MSKKMNAAELRKLVLETIQEVDGPSNRKEEFAAIVENATRLVEEADPSKVDPSRFPMDLSSAAGKAGEEAEKLVTGGNDDGASGDDEVKAQAGSLPCKVLKPSQSSMNIEKACAFAIAAILKVKPFPSGPGGDLGAIITSDNHIMDGHHRWIASGMVDPDAEVGGFIVEFPAKQMIAALNMITVKLGITQGKPGSGGFDQFNEEGISEVLKKFASEGVWATGGDPAKVVEACEQFTGATGDAAVEAAAKKMAENVSQLTLSVPDGFPSRPDMPVISKGKGHLDQAIELLRSGQVDLNEPYAESVSKKDDVIVERWNKLAGLLK